jgi:RNA polymerase sigma factor (sigma-70 family)
MSIAAPALSASADLPTTTTKKFSAKALRDFALIERILDHHDERAYSELMGHYQKAVYQLVVKMVHQSDVAEDLALEVFVRAFRSLHTFRPEFAFSTWLFRVATNLCIAHLHRQFAGEETSFDLPDSTPTPQEALIQLQRIEQMHLAVAKLPAKYQQLMQLHYFEELSYEEVAARQHLPVGTVKGQLHRGRDLLHQLLGPAQRSL